MQVKSHEPKTQIGEPPGGAPHCAQVGPQLLSSCGTQSCPQLWNPAAPHRKVHLPLRQPATKPGGIPAVQSSQTFTPQSSGVLVHGPSTTIA